MENDKVLRILEKNITNDSVPHWVTKKDAIAAMVDIVRIERALIKRRLKKFIMEEKNHDEFMYPWEHI